MTINHNSIRRIGIAILTLWLGAGYGQLPSISPIAAPTGAEVAAQQSANEANRAELNTQEAELTKADITLDYLEKARLDLEVAETAVRASESVVVELEKQRSRHTASLEALRARQRKLEVDGGTNGDVDAVMAEAGQLEARLDVLIGEIQRSTALRDLRRANVAIAAERLQLFRGRFDVSQLDSLPEPQDPARQQLQAEAQRYAEQARQYRGRLIVHRDDSEYGAARKQSLELQAQNAEERAELARLSLSLVDEKAALLALQRLADSAALPPAAISHARDKAESLRGEVRTQREQLQRRIERLEGQLTIATERAGFSSASPRELAEQSSLLSGLIIATNEAVEQADDVVKAADSVAGYYAIVLQRSLQRNILLRRQWPADAQAWRDLAAGLGELGLRIVRSVGDELSTLAIAMREARLWVWPKFLLGLVGIFAVLLWLRRALRSRVLKYAKETGTTLPVNAVQENLLSGSVTLALLLLAWLLGLQAAELPLLLTMTLTWPVIALLTSLARLLLFDVLPSENAQRRAATLPSRTKLYSRIKTVLWLLGMVIATTVIARFVPLSPAVAHAVDVIAMACLLGLSIPLLRLRFMVRHTYGDSVAQQNASLRVVLKAGLVAPVVLFISSLMGLVGYVDLAWLVIRHTLLILLVGAAVWVLRGLVRDATTSLLRYTVRHKHADLLGAHFLIPLRNVISLALVVGGGWLLLRLFDPALTQIVTSTTQQVLAQPLFAVADTMLKVQDIALGIAFILAVVWGGRWLKGVSYYWPFGAIDDVGIRHSLATFLQYLVVVAGFVVALKIIGIDLTAMTIFAGALGVGIGFGLQNIANNFISGVLLLMERPLKSGDIVSIGPHEGAVTELGMRSLTLRTWDRRDVIVPNSAIIAEPFTNWTHDDNVIRGITQVGISYQDDPHAAIALVEELLASEPLVLKTSAPLVMVEAFGASSIDLRIEFYCDLRGHLNRFQVRSKVLLGVWDAFREAGITIPYPQSEVTVKRDDGGELAIGG